MLWRTWDVPYDQQVLSSTVLGALETRLHNSGELEKCQSWDSHLQFNDV